MSISAAEIMTFGGQRLPFAQDLREALANYARRTWPVNTSVHMAQAWKLSKDTAKNVLKGHASDATITKILQAGGWALALPVMGAVIGEPVHEFFRDQMKQAAKAAEHARHHEELAQAAYGRLADDAAAARQARRQGKGAGKVGSDEARRVAR